MINVIKKFKNSSFEEKTIYSTIFSIISNTLFAIGKIILSFFNSVFFLVAGIVNIFVILSKLECFLGIKYPHKKSFRFRNNLIGVFLMLSGIEYAIYMTRLVFTNQAVMKYDGVLAVIIAFISFVEMGFAIKGCFDSYGKGHYYRNIKLINLCSAFTSIVLTEIALTSFASETDTRVINGLFGMVVALIIILISIFVFIIPKISILDHEYNVYQKIKNTKLIDKEAIDIQLTFSKVFGNYVYKGIVKNDIVEGMIVKGKSPMRNWNIWIKILLIVLSEILIFVYAIWGLVFFFRSSNIIDLLDNQMKELGYKKINVKE